MRILYLVTARSGSKGIPKKNIRVVGELPLIAYKIISAKKSRYQGRIIVSTDSEEIRDIGLSYGAEAPFLRPVHLAQDDSRSEDVIHHALDWLKQNEGQEYDVVSLMEPSSPFARHIDLDGAFDILVNTGCESVLSVSQVKVAPVFINELDPLGRMSIFYHKIAQLKSTRRQDFIPYYTLNGAMYIFRTEYFLRTHMVIAENTVPYIMEENYGMEIDEECDLDLVSFMLDKKMIDMTYWKI